MEKNYLTFFLFLYLYREIFRTFLNAILEFRCKKQFSFHSELIKIILHGNRDLSQICRVFIENVHVEDMICMEMQHH